jgi:pimeloyl-ACP methyl ester carboxylesterase
MERPVISRRGLLQGGTVLAVGGAVLADGGAAEAATNLGGESPLRAIPVPDQVPATEGFVDVPGARLWYWDTGGNGTPIVFLHPGSGSGESWPYQQPFFAKAGHRVIGYSRRGYYNSEAGPPDDPGTPSGDLHSLVDGLGVGRFHAVGVAAGGGYALDYALSHPDRLLSLVIATSVVAGLAEQDYTAILGRLRPSGFSAMPVDFRELGPAYRAADADGVARWLAIEERAVTTAVSQPNANSITWAKIEQLQVPTLLLWGDGDLYTSPPVQRLLASHFPRAETVVANECGHNVHWERSDIFNSAVLNFIRKYPG